MLNALWAGMMAAGIFWAAFHGNMGEVTNGLLDSAKEAVTLGVIHVLIIISIRRKGNLSMRGYAGKEEKKGFQIRQSGENVGKAALCVGCIQCAGMCCCLLTF